MKQHTNIVRKGSTLAEMIVAMTVDLMDSVSLVARKVVYRSTNQMVSRDESVSDRSIRREDLVLGERSYATFQWSAQDKVARFEIQTATGQVATPVRVDRRIEALIRKSGSHP